ncbi:MULTISPECIES: GNAT family N-acetyltransferase [Halanaerobium]|uniref:Acetyltransferase (GNAT) family protein n=1 Tax=Halanaerobium kushneri TaxID=56779 RepID=A0A1N6PJ72_9FIRM|nr:MULTISPECIES: GNAT family N-acetyltransferase [Halanaerobium]SDL02548.1 Acetyltransferase (GNAT) family protein [Halanaerobium congolense]SDN10650.1 Acetyltransferase (GNAT) family protein [Halanaerobium congolense]SIQ04346.1 Acetyltransferase (GNAT) family protein [Halanaerobium kushneri]
MPEIRAMKKNEAEQVRRLGKKTFEWFESLFIPKPKDCYVALEDNKIIGAVLYKYLTIADKKIGYVDYIFVDKAFHGKGIGSKLVDHCLDTMKKEECDGYSAVVRDDNVGSWKMFINKNLKRVGLNDLIRQFGVLGMLNLTFKTPFNFATGMDYYLKLEDNAISQSGEKSIFQIFKYLIFTALLLLPLFIYGFKNAFYIIGAVVSILAIRLVFGYLGTLFSNENWYFRVCDGGYLIPFIAALLGGIFFISGNWYPKVYRQQKDFKRSLGLTALTQLISLFLIVFLTRTLLSEFSFFKTMSSISATFMIINVVPFYPLASFGGKRLFEWNKWLYAIVLLISIYIIFLY